MSEKSDSNFSAKLIDIQTLRGLAAILVMLYHAGSLYFSVTGTPLFGHMFSAGFVGVDVFFVISGFIILWVHKKDVGQSGRVVSFTIKRAFRLLPIYWLIVVLKSLKDAQNFDIVVFVCALLLIPHPFPPYINLSWTLSLEVLFYLIFALVLATKTKYLALIVIGLMSSLALLQRPFNSNGDAILSVLNFYFDPHLFEFALGMFIAWALARKSIFYPLQLLVVGVSGWVVVFVLTTIHGMNSSGVTNGYVAAQHTAIWFGIPTAVALYGLVGRELLGGKAVSEIFKPLGDISYSLYLIHGFVIHNALSIAFFRSTVETWPSLIILPMILSLVLAAASYRYIEKPFINFGKKWG